MAELRLSRCQGWLPQKKAEEVLYIYIYIAMLWVTLHYIKRKVSLAATPCGMTFETMFFALSRERSSTISFTRAGIV